MKYSKNRKKKIVARVTRDRDSLGRRIKKTSGLPFVSRLSRVFFSFCNIVRRGESGCFSLNFLLVSFKKTSSLFDSLILIHQSEKPFFSPLLILWAERVVSLLAAANFSAWKIAGLFCLLIKTFFLSLLVVVAPKCSHRIIALTGNISLSRLVFFFSLSLAPYHHQNIPLGPLRGTPQRKGLIELNWINMTLCMSFQPKRNIALWCPRVYDYTGYWLQHLKATCVLSDHPNSPSLSLSLSWLLVYSEARLNRKHR